MGARRRSLYMLLAGLSLFPCGVGLLVAAYAGRDTGNMSLALFGVTTVLAGVSLAAVAALLEIGDRRRNMVIDSVGFPAGAPGSRQLPPTGEKVLMSFGPFGTDVCNGPYRVFSTWHRRNSVIVTLTDWRIYVAPNRSFGLLSVPAMNYSWGVRLPFEIPYSAIISASLNRHPSPIAAMEVMYIEYGENGSRRDVSIASYRRTIRRAFEIVSGREGTGTRANRPKG